jgi:hypothetical protein
MDVAIVASATGTNSIRGPTLVGSQSSRAGAVELRVITVNDGGQGNHHAWPSRVKRVGRRDH